MFDFDRSDIRYSESRKPAEVAAYMSQNPSVRLGLAGYTDRQSTDQYNQPLSQRRVATVRDADSGGGGGGSDRDRHVRYGSVHV
jgi:outer membrane protein OmpA-like peptidoglycan-associated protein